MKTGFACVWHKDPISTWSYTPWNLREAMTHETSLVDAGIHLGKGTRLWLKALNLKLRRRRLIAHWNPSAAFERVARQQMAQAVARHRIDVLLQIGEISHTSAPYFLYHDFGYDIVLSHRELGLPMLGYRNHSLSDLERLRERQHRFYEKAAGIFAMSDWFADSLVERHGIPRSKVHVVHAGVNGATRSAPTPVAHRDAAQRTRLLFIGGDFFRKGGDLVVKALARLREEADPALTLTIAGPAEWPLPSEPPPGVRFLGKVPLSEVGPLFASHDLFVMPSRFEGFGIVFVEALAHGLPVVGRNVCAMPEIIRPGMNGQMVRSDDVDELASAILGTLRDDDIYAAVRRGTDEALRYFSWQRVAREMVATMKTA